MINNEHRATTKQRGGAKAAQAEAAFDELMRVASQRGFFGSVSLTLSVQDGCVQQTRLGVDRLLR
ncbi:hypothetical protein [Botrimarina sp.]|uniref:hypothetical protein n=1 Tax=Botrimarina sp. TaxID=2795802 RepID=UPI0032EF34F5